MTMESIHAIIASVLRPDGFFVKPPSRWACSLIQAETRRWELFRGQLLDPNHTRETATFTAWHVQLSPADRLTQGPILSLRLAPEPPHRVYVTRSFAAFGQTTYMEHGAIHAQPAEKWHEELVGVWDTDVDASPEAHAQALQAYVEQGLVGTSRLPITSVESPHPLYLLGRLAYLPGPAGATSTHAAEPISRPAELLARLQQANSSASKARLLDFLFRTASAEECLPLYQTDLMSIDAWPVWQSFFQRLALNHGRHLLDRLMSCLRDGCTPALRERIVSRYLIGLVRHLSAFDLKRFHGQGSNYPDALFLDALLKAGLRSTTDATGRSADPCLPDQQRAFRQGWMMRKELEGLSVPAEPLSPGDQMRVWSTDAEEPPGEPRPRLRLFASEPAEDLLDDAARESLRQAVVKLSQPEELFELGRATFLDRPLGLYKQQQRVFQDRTPLFSYQSWSQRLTRQRLHDWRRWGWLDGSTLERLLALVNDLSPKGVPATAVALPQPRPGVVGLEDVLLAQPDFIFIRSTRSSLADLLNGYDFTPLDRHPASLGAWLNSPDCVLILRTPLKEQGDPPRSLLTAYDARGSARLELGPAQPFDQPREIRYREWAGVEYLADGLRLMRCWDAQGAALPFEPREMIFPPRRPGR